MIRRRAIFIRDDKAVRLVAGSFPNTSGIPVLRATTSDGPRSGHDCHRADCQAAHRQFGQRHVSGSPTAGNVTAHLFGEQRQRAALHKASLEDVYRGLDERGNEERARGFAQCRLPLCSYRTQRFLERHDLHLVFGNRQHALRRVLHEVFDDLGNLVLGHHLGLGDIHRVQVGISCQFPTKGHHLKELVCRGHDALGRQTDGRTDQIQRRRYARVGLAVAEQVGR